MAQNPNALTPWLTAARRRYIYKVAVALVPLASALGLVTDEIVPLIVGVIAAVLSTSTAVLHTPREDR